MQRFVLNLLRPQASGLGTRVPGKAETGNFPTNGAAPHQQQAQSRTPLLPGEPPPSRSPRRLYGWALPRHPQTTLRRAQPRARPSARTVTAPSGRTHGSRLSLAPEPGAKPGWFPPRWEKGIPALSHGAAQAHSGHRSPPGTVQPPAAASPSKSVLPGLPGASPAGCTLSSKMSGLGT